MKKWREKIEGEIANAINNEEFKNLKGYGKPLKVDSNPFIPEEAKMSYKIMKNAGILPPEVQAKKQLGEVEEKLKQEGLSEALEKELRREQQNLQLKMNLYFDNIRRG